MSRADLIRSAVARHSSMSTRAENMDIDKDHRLYVDNPQHDTISSMQGAASQILFGRRGTGKTMMLRKLLRMGYPYEKEADYIAILLQTFDFTRSSVHHGNDGPKLRARAHFREFLNQVSHRLLEIGDQLFRDEALLARLALKNRSRRELLEDKFLQLSAVLQYGGAVLQPEGGTFIHELRIAHRQSKEGLKRYISGAHVRSDGRIDLGQLPKLTIGGGHSRVNDSSSKSQSEYEKTAHFECHQNYQFGLPEIRDLLRGILEHLSVSRLVVIIDEWHEMRECQAEFADLLRRTFFGIDSISVKIAAYRNMSSFSNGGVNENFRGMEVGQDIDDAGDLDAMPDQKDSESYFAEMLYRRLILHEPQLEDHYGPPDKFDHTMLVNDMFQNGHAFSMLIRGSHGVSRDFLEVFNRASVRANYDIGRAKLSLSDVQGAHRRQCQSFTQDFSHSDDVGGFLFEVIKPHVSRTRNPYFFINRRNYRWNLTLWDLAAKHAIHPVSDEILPDGLEVEWTCYEVSYGLFQLWKEAARWAGVSDWEAFVWTEIEDITPDDIARNELRLDGAGRPSSLRICANCSEQFSTAAHSFIKKGLCPHCYERPEPGN